MRYRDTKTGRFVSASTWRRSRAHGGTRYRRITRKSLKRTGPRPKPHPSTVSTTAPPYGFAPVTGPIPVEFLEAADEFFESGYESEEEEEYP